MQCISERHGHDSGTHPDIPDKTRELAADTRMASRASVHAGLGANSATIAKVSSIIIAAAISMCLRSRAGSDWPFCGRLLHVCLEPVEPWLQYGMLMH